jgi:hypothetical protein
LIGDFRYIPELEAQKKLEATHLSTSASLGLEITIEIMSSKLVTAADEAADT